MQHQEFGPPDELKDTIKCFWYDSTHKGKKHNSFEVQPDGYAEIIFYFGSSLSVVSHTGLKPLSSPFLIGLLNQPIVFETKGSLEVLGIRCYPWTVFDLLGLRAGKDDLRMFNHSIAELHPCLNSLVGDGKIVEAISCLQEYMSNERAGVTPNSMLHKAGLAMRNANGAIPVSEVADAAHTTLRTLERKFKLAAGYSVKDVSGWMRFEQARNSLWHKPDVNLSALAYELGYTDQSHLTKEFKRYSGTTPAAFVHNAQKDRQMLSSDYVAFLQS